MLETQNSHYEIFLASRFEEFKELRGILREKINQYKFMKAIDLNNNEASTRSPLAESLFYAKKSEVMILLVGESYGTIPDGEELSYTHLEYKEAIKDNSNTRVLVFCIGKSYKSIIEYSDDINMSNWQRELERNHRIKKFEDTDNVKDIAEKISVDLLTSLYELNLINNKDLNLNTVDLEIIENNFDDEFLLEDSDSILLDNQYQEDEEINLIIDNNDKIEGFELLKIPNTLAAIEQKQEAQYAIDIRDYSTAIKHLKKALDLKPLDFETNYWLAKLYITSAKKSLFFEIEEYLLRAAKIAEKNNNIFRASHCYLLIVQASIFSDKKHEGEKYIKLAEELTKNFAKVYYEKAKFLFSFNENVEAKQAIDECLKIKMDFLEQINSDPFFIPYKNEIDEYFKEMKSKLYKTTDAILYNTNNIREIFDMPIYNFNISQNSITELWQNARRGILSQYKIISNNLKILSNDSIEKFESEKIFLENELNEKYKKIKISFDESIYKLEKDKINKIEIIDKKAKNDTFISITKRNNMFFVLGTLVLLSILFYKNNYNLFIFTFISSILTTSAIYYFSRQVKKIFKNKNLEIQEINNSFLDEEERFLSDKLSKEKNYENQFNLTLKSINHKIDEYKINIKKVKKAIEIFESKSLTLSEAKFIPFRSLNKARKDSIIRVHKFSKKLESDFEIEILEDFLSEYEIEKIFDEENNIKYSFLGKVKNKFKNKIVLSRFEAYLL